MKIKPLVTSIVTGAIGVTAGMGYEFIKEEKRLDKMQDKTNKFETFYRLLITWLEAKQDGKDFSDYFERNEIKTVAIYGMAGLGERLLQELIDTNVEVKYIIDQNADNIVTSLPKCKPCDELDRVDAIIVTAVYYYQDIEEMLAKKVDYQIISLEDIVYSL